MDKTTFLSQLQKRLKGLPEEELRQTLEYYAEMIDDRMEEGFSQEEAVAEVGTVEEIARPLLPKTPRRKRKGWELALLILGFPLWFPLLIAVFAVAISLIASLYAVVVSFAACCVGGMLCSVLYGLQRSWAGAAFVFGCGLACGGFALLGFWGSNGLMKVSGKALKTLFRKER
ncbi:MAG: hypothetical protein IKJ94_07450 [Oscillospiraceae bacterium]|nr:hypothetical protein [Oscillospiraceae bacterium]